MRILQWLRKRPAKTIKRPAQPAAPEWDYKPLAKHNRNRVMSLTLGLLLVVTSQAIGAIGETPKQMEPRKPDYVLEHDGGVTMTWRGKKLTHSGFFKDGK